MLRFCAWVSVHTHRHQGMHIPVAICMRVLMYMEICISWHAYIKTHRTHTPRHEYHDIEMSGQHACRDMHNAYCNMHTGGVTWKHTSRCTHDRLDMKHIKTCVGTVICVPRSQHKQAYCCTQMSRHMEISWHSQVLWHAVNDVVSTVCWDVPTYMLRYACACQNMHIKIGTPFTHWYTYMYVDIYIWDPMDCSTPGSPVLHYLPEFLQTHIHWVGDAI